ncbi:MAG TPA: SurA N-terminal domain-containing protein [Geopsychrobacteraceae bacterium]|nr:SurA N-terminal domain-containing protein [Geopsychrobacteraceae bacterium]
MKRVMTFCLLLVLFVSPAMAVTVSRVAAIVNDDIITTFQLEQAVASAQDKNNLGKLSGSALKQLQNQTLEKMIDEKLLLQRVRELGLTVTESELEAAINDVQMQNNLTREQLISALNAQGMDFPTYRKNLEQELMRYRLIGREVNSQVEVTSKEIREYFREHIDEYRIEPTIHLKRISFDVPRDASDEQKAAVRELAETVRNKLIVDKEPFDVVLATLANAADSDDMGSIEESSLLPVFQEALRGLEAGQATKPIAATGSIHLFFVAERNPGDSNLFDKVKGEIVEILRGKNTEKRYAEWSRELREKANIEILL